MESQFDYLALLVLSQEIEVIEMEEIAKLLQEFKEVLPSVLKQNEQLGQSVSNLQSKIRRLEKEFDSFKTSLIAGQIVSSFERAVVQKILQESAEKDKNRTDCMKNVKNSTFVTY